MNILGANRYISQDFITHKKTAEDYSGEHLGKIYIKGIARVILVVNKYISHEDSINYNDFLNNMTKWKDNNYYNCISITGKNIRFPQTEMGGNCVILEGLVEGAYRKYGIFHMDKVLVNVGDIVKSDTLLGYQGNTGLVTSGKAKEDRSYGTHIHMEVQDQNGTFLDPREYALGNKEINYINNTNLKDEKKLQGSIIVNNINIRKDPNTESLILGKVYNKEIYDILEIIKKDDYTWYKIKTGNNILGYIANKNGSNWVKLHEPIKEENDFIELYTCLKDDTYYIKLYQGEKLYLKK